MKKVLIIALFLLLVVVGYSQSPEQVVRTYVTTLNDFLMSPNNSSARKKLENILDGSIIQDGLYIKYKDNVSIEDIKARDYVGILADVINSNSDDSYANVAIACNLETTNGGIDVVAYLAYTGAISMNTVTVFHVESGRIKVMDNDFIKTKAWADGKTPCSTSTPMPSPLPNSVNHEFVDLGLPSGTLWATCNVGANNPWEYGDYFAWGETTPKTDYSWSTYKYANGAYNKLTKYCNNKEYGNKRFTDSRTTLERSDDVAYFHWGSNWSMPTQSQWVELKAKCTWTWATYNGINGYEVKGSNGKSIFLPATDIKTSSYVETLGFYWSSSLDLSEPKNAHSLYFYSNRVLVGLMCYRCSGLSVRPVRSKTNE